MFYGDRSGAIEDPFGHQWYVSTHIEDLTVEEIGKRMAAVKKTEQATAECDVEMTL